MEQVLLLLALYRTVASSGVGERKSFFLPALSLIVMVFRLLKDCDINLDDEKIS